MQNEKMLLDVFEAIKQRKSLIPARASSCHSGAFEDVKFRVMASSLVNVVALIVQQMCFVRGQDSFDAFRVLGISQTRQ